MSTMLVTFVSYRDFIKTRKHVKNTETPKEFLSAESEVYECIRMFFGGHGFVPIICGLLSYFLL